MKPNIQRARHHPADGERDEGREEKTRIQRAGVRKSDRKGDKVKTDIPIGNASKPM